MKYKIILIGALLNVFSCSIIKENLFIGEVINSIDCNFLSEVEKNFKTKFNDSFSSQDFSLKNFYSQLENEAINLKSKKTITSYLKNADQIIFNIGNEIFLKYINYSYDQFDYDDKVISADIEMFEYYLTSIFEIIQTYKLDIIVVSPYQYLLLNNKHEEKYLGILNRYIDVLDNVTTYYQINIIKPFKMRNYIVRDKIINAHGVQYLIDQLMSVWK